MADEQQRKLNFNINDGDSFYANEISITFVPTQFAFDFKNISPRVDIRNQEGTENFVLKHNVVLVDPFQIKQFAIVLGQAVERYEKEFGKIEKPEAIKKIEENMKKNQKKTTTTSKSHDVPSYFG